MNPIVFAMRRPVTVIVLVICLVLASFLAVTRMRIDIFPNLRLPVVYVCQPYGGMDPAQMEGLLTNYYEYHFLYINGIHHVESRNVQGMALMKLFFHPGTDMAQAMAETIGYVTRSRAFMPPGTVSPFVTRFDAGSVPVGYLVLSSQTKTIAEIQDQALFKVRPMFASLPGVSAPPPFGGSQRTVVVRLDQDRLRSYRVSPDEVIRALSSGNVISPSGTIRVDDQMPIVPINSMVRDVNELLTIPIRPGANPTIYLRDVATVQDSSDIPVGYALVDGRRAVYILVTKRADASTLDVVRAVKAALPDMKAVLPEDIDVRFAFDQSPTVTRAIRSLVIESALGAALIGLMVLLFLRDWRSVIIVVLNIPFALSGALVGLWLTGETLNLMTLGGLALAVGILVDESTVELENIHTQLKGTDSVALAVRRGNQETAVPRLLAMLCILAVFVPSYFMQGAARSLFVPLAMAVGFAMVASYVLSSTFVPVMAAWLLKGHVSVSQSDNGRGVLALLRGGYESLSQRITALRWLVVPAYLAVAALLIFGAGRELGLELFPRVDSGRFQIRMKAPTGTRVESTEATVKKVLEAIGEEAGRENVEITVGYVGLIPSSYPINAIHQWSGGPEEAIVRVGLKEGSGVDVEKLKRTLRTRFQRELPQLQCSFEPADIVSDVMSFGSPTPVEVAVSGPSFPDTRAYSEKLKGELAKLGSLQDLRFAQALDYPTVSVQIDRQRAGLSGVTAEQVARSVVAATSSSRFVVPNYWPDPKSGIGYQVQVEIPYQEMDTLRDVETIPIEHSGNSPLLLRDVAAVSRGTMAGEYDRYNMKRSLSLTATLSGRDLGQAGREVDAAIKRAGAPPKGVVVDVRGQIAPMREILRGLAIGLIVAVGAILMMLAAFYQSFRLAAVALATAPAVLAGVLIALRLTQTTINLQSFLGAIMALGVAVANAILLVTFAERNRKTGTSARQAAVEAARDRLRPILMTSAAMIAGMVPMALGLGEGGEQTAPLGRAVIGGLAGSTLATLLVLPSVFAIVQARAKRRSASVDPFDPESARYIHTSADTGPEMDFDGQIIGKNAGAAAAPTASPETTPPTFTTPATRDRATDSDHQIEGGAIGRRSMPLVTKILSALGMKPSRRGWCAPVLGVTLIAASGCNPKLEALDAKPPDGALDAANTQAQPSPGDSVVARVVVIQPERADIKRVSEQPGLIEAFEEAPIHARIGGYVAKVSVDIGDQVEKGQILAELDVPELVADVAQKAATVKQSQAELSQTEASRAVAAAELTSVQASQEEAQAAIARATADADRWRAEAARVEQLARTGAITSSLRDETRSKQQSAEAAVAEAKARLRSAEAGAVAAEASVLKATADIAVAQAKIAVAEAEQRHAEAMLDFARITAPFPGVVTARNVDPGHLTIPGGAAEPLFIVDRRDQVTAVLAVPEADAAMVDLGDPVSIRLPSLQGKTIESRIQRVSWTLDQSTRTLRAEVDLPSEQGPLRPGLYVVGLITGDARQNALTVPLKAVFKEADKTYVVAIQNNKAVRMEVALGLSDGTRVEVLSGLDGSEQIVAANPEGLRDGQDVMIAEPPKS